MNSSLKLGTVLTIIAVIASAMAVMFVLHAESDNSSAEVVESGWCGPDMNYYIYSDGTLKISGTGEMYDYEYVRAPWYEHRDDIKAIQIDSSVTQLGAWAFVGLKHVTKLTLPITLNTVVSDLSPAFAGCYSIEKITFTCGTNGCGYNYSAYVGNNCWYQNTPWYQSRDSLKEITFAYGTEYIGSDSFRELNITSLVIPDSVGSLGSHCFFNCTELTDLTIPVSLNSYGVAECPAFEGCVAVENVTITRGNGVPFDYSDWEGIFHCNLAPWNLNGNIAKKIVVSDDVGRLGKFMFYYTNIKELTIPVGATSYSAVYTMVYAFLAPYDSLEKVTITKGTGASPDYSVITESSVHNPWNKAPNLKSIVVEEGVTYLGTYTFAYCKVNTLILPNSLVSLGKDMSVCLNVRYLTLPISVNAVQDSKDPAFRGITGLWELTLTPGTGYGVDYSTDKFSDYWYQSTPWYLSMGYLTEITLQEGIRSLGSNAFCGMNIDHIIIPDSVESLGDHTFYQCRDLYDLALPISLDCSGSAFDECDWVCYLRFTGGTDGVGFDYTDHLPFWCTSSKKSTLITFDSRISYIGTNTFVGYHFFASDQNELQPVAEDLSGHRFCGAGGELQMLDKISDEIVEISVSFDFFNGILVVISDLTKIWC